MSRSKTVKRKVVKIGERLCNECGACVTPSAGGPSKSPEPRPPSPVKTCAPRVFLDGLPPGP